MSAIKGRRSMSVSENEAKYASFVPKALFLNPRITSQEYVSRYGSAIGT